MLTLGRVVAQSGRRSRRSLASLRPSPAPTVADPSVFSDAPTPPPPSTSPAFDALTPDLREGLARMGIDTPTPIQAQAVERVLAGEDVVCSAPTTSGTLNLTRAYTTTVTYVASSAASVRAGGRPDGSAARITDETCGGGTRARRGEKAGLLAPPDRRATCDGAPPERAMAPPRACSAL